METGNSVTIWLNQLRGGDGEAADRLWRVYFSRVSALARARFGSKPQKSADAEDVALSVIDTLCRGIAAGKYAQLSDRQGLWPLLAVLTVRKVCDRIQAEQREKRGGGRVQSEGDIGNEDFRLDDVLAEAPTPEALAIMEEESARLLALLDDDLRRIAQGKLEGYTNQELASQLDCGLRTIERRLDLIRRLWEQALLKP